MYTYVWYGRQKDPEVISEGRDCALWERPPLSESEKENKIVRVSVNRLFVTLLGQSVVQFI